MSKISLTLNLDVRGLDIKISENYSNVEITLENVDQDELLNQIKNEVMLDHIGQQECVEYFNIEEKDVYEDE